MKLITLGDSITRGTHIDDNGHWAVAEPNYSQGLQSLLGFDELLCLGVNGVSVSATSPVNSGDALCLLCAQAQNADILIIAGGTNDYGTSVEIGDKTDERDVSFYGGLDILYRKARENNPNAQIYVVLPIRRRNENTPNEKGYVLDDYRAAIAYKAAQYAYPTIDGRNLAIDPENEEQRLAYIRDGLHPSTRGHKLYAQFLYKEIVRLQNAKGETVC